MAWRDHLDQDEHRIIQQGFSHHGFAKTARWGLFAAVESILVRRLPASEANTLRNQIRIFKHQARIGQHPYDQMIGQIDSWVLGAINAIDSRTLSGRIRTATDWMDDTLEGVIKAVDRDFRHHFR